MPDEVRPLRDVDVIYPCHNRLYYTQITFPRVLHECKLSTRFRKLWVYNDASTDGTEEFLVPLLEGTGIDYEHDNTAVGNSVDQINRTVPQSEAKYLCKIDNDILIPEGYIDHLAALMDKHRTWGFVMARQAHTESNEADDGFPGQHPAATPQHVERSHVGGVGLFRASIFSQQGIIATDKRYFGFTAYQAKAQEELGVKCVQANTLVTLNLDTCPWWSRKTEYTKTGDSRNMFGKVPGPFNGWDDV